MLSAGLPDCTDPESPEPCPLEEIKKRMAAGGRVEDEEYRLAEGECDTCFWSSEEYTDLTTYGDLWRFGLDYLRRREIGLEPEDLSPLEESVVLFVHSEIESGRAKRMNPKSKADPVEINFPKE